ncbi:lipid II flippase family protein [Ureibacillus sp. GCM10028918]|uniref:lipid II flippase family protein n=1 Tax=Ureibacillus sp. GCM10028918 TaxID=3273429 RepID=UPI0036121A7D
MLFYNKSGVGNVFGIFHNTVSNDCIIHLNHLFNRDIAYAVRLSGAIVKQLASALSLFNLMVMVSRLTNMMQQPFTGSLIGKAPKENSLEFVENQYRILIGSATLGTIIGLILLPTFLQFFRGQLFIFLAEERGSIPALVRIGYAVYLI